MRKSGSPDIGSSGQRLLKNCAEPSDGSVLPSSARQDRYAYGRCPSLKPGSDSTIGCRQDGPAARLRPGRCRGKPDLVRYGSAVHRRFATKPRRVQHAPRKRRAVRSSPAKRFGKRGSADGHHRGLKPAWFAIPSNQARYRQKHAAGFQSPGLKLPHHIDAAACG